MKLREALVPKCTDYTGIYDGVEYKDWMNKNDYTPMREISPDLDDAFAKCIKTLEYLNEILSKTGFQPGEK